MEAHNKPWDYWGLICMYGAGKINAQSLFVFWVMFFLSRTWEEVEDPQPYVCTYIELYALSCYYSTLQLEILTLAKDAGMRMNHHCLIGAFTQANA